MSGMAEFRRYLLEAVESVEQRKQREQQEAAKEERRRRRVLAKTPEEFEGGTREFSRKFGPK